MKTVGLSCSLPAVVLACLLSGCVGTTKGSGETVVDTTTSVDSDSDPPLSDLDSDGFDAPEDCDDFDPLTYPGAEELIDTVDQDCDGELSGLIATANYAFFLPGVSNSQHGYGQLSACDMGADEGDELFVSPLSGDILVFSGDGGSSNHAVISQNGAAPLSGVHCGTGPNGDYAYFTSGADIGWTTESIEPSTDEVFDAGSLTFLPAPASVNCEGPLTCFPLDAGPLLFSAGGGIALAVGARGADITGTDGGAVYLVQFDSPTTASVGRTITSCPASDTNCSFEYFGRAAVFPVDLLGDLSGTVVIGHSTEESMIIEVEPISNASLPESYLLEAASSPSAFGSSLATGDLDGDGDSDLAIGAPAANGGDGEVWLVPGGCTPSGDVDNYSCGGDQATVILPPVSVSGLGGNVGELAIGKETTTWAGDLNGDGYGDLVMGRQTAYSSSGRAWVVFGSATLFSGTSEVLDDLVADGRAMELISPAGSNESLGTSITSAFSFPDRPCVGVGAPGTQSTDAGGVYVWCGPTPHP